MVAGRTAGGVGPEEVRRHNLSTVLRQVHAAGPLTRAELGARVGLQRTTIKDLVAELQELGAVRESDSAADPGTPRAAGRPSRLVSARPDAVQVLAVDIRVDRVLVALVGLGGVVLARRFRSLPATSEHPASAGTVAAVAARLAQVLTPDLGQGRVLACGVSVPGVVGPTDGLVRFAPNLGWTDVELGRALADRLPGVVLRFGNDAVLGALAEHRRGVGRGVEDLVFVVGDVGVGAGIILGGRSATGAGGYAGEIGHLPVRPGGLPCRCGALGCWETEIGAPAVAHALGMSGVGSDEMVSALRRHPELADRLDGVAASLGVGLAAVVNLLNPAMIVLGGLLRELFPATQDRVRAALARAALRAPAEQVQLRTPELGGSAVLLGAAELAWDDVLADPAAALSGPDARPAVLSPPAGSMRR